MTLFKRLQRAIISWLARRLPDCKTITPICGEALDRKPIFREKIRMQVHLFTCDACTRYVRQIKFLREAMHAHGEKSLEADQVLTAALSSDAKARMINLLKIGSRLSL